MGVQNVGITVYNTKITELEYYTRNEWRRCKTTLETSGEDMLNPLETSGEDVLFVLHWQR
jgi:hypothetical protein